jgi:hypothetical protein
MFLHCNGFTKRPQTDCGILLPDGTLSYVNRYDIRSQSFDHIHSNIALTPTPTQLFQQFVQHVNSQVPYNKGGTINAFPIITFSKSSSSSLSESVSSDMIFQAGNNLNKD